MSGKYTLFYCFNLASGSFTPEKPAVEFDENAAKTYNYYIRVVVPMVEKKDGRCLADVEI